MATEELRDFVEERLRAYDPDIDLTDGSPAQDQVVDPIVRRYQPDPFEMDVESFITTRLNQEYPTYNVREGSGLRDLLVKPNRILLDPISREVSLIKQGQSLANPELLAPTEADALVANMFVTRTTGGLATGTVRLYFNAPVAINISVGNVAYTPDGLRFIPTTLQSISAEAMIFNQSGNLYYFDVQFTAEEAGTQYNVDPHQIMGITNLNSAVRVENPEKFRGGLDGEETEDLVARAETSITERSLVVARGVSARLREQFEDLVHLQIVGFTDVEMLRDIITGGDLGPVLLSNNDGYTEDDGDGDVWTSSFKSYYTDFTTLFGATGSVTNYKLEISEANYGADGEVNVANLDHFISLSAPFQSSDVDSVLITFDCLTGNIGVAQITSYINSTKVELSRTGVAETGIHWILLRPHREYDILSVLGTNELLLDGNLPVDKPALSWSIRQRVLTLSDIPGGILYSADQEAIEIQSDEIHIGGATDFYVRGTETDSEELVLAAISDASPVLRALTGRTIAGSPNEEFFRDPTKDFVALGVEPGMSLVIETGVDAGTKRILRVGVSPGGSSDPTYLQIDPVVTSTASDLRYKIVDDIDVNLKEPKTVRGEGTDLQTVQLSNEVTTNSSVDFLALGTEIGDVLEILEGNDEGQYSINAITGTGNRVLQISGDMAATANNLSWKVYKLYDGIDFPLVRIKSIDILDSSNQPTGDIIPYAEPVDARSTTFSNAGRGVKVSTTDAITGIVGTVDLSGLAYPGDLAGVVLNVSVNDAVAIPIDLTGSTGVNDILYKINTAIFNIAGTITVDGETRLTIRSGDRWLKVEAAAANAVVGLDVAGEDNRQIKSAGNISDWSNVSYGLIPEKDSVSIITGDDIGFLYLVAVDTDKILAVGFDETSGAVRFLQPNARVSMSVGSRSYGKARVYFMDPTSFDVRGSWRPALRNTDDNPANRAVWEAPTGSDTIPTDEPEVSYFTVSINGAELRFVPDPELRYQILPPPEDDYPNNLGTTLSSPTVQTLESPAPGDLGKNSRDVDLDFLSREVRVGDWLEITYQPIQGSTDIRPTPTGTITYPTGIQGLTLTLSIDGAIPRTLTFSDQLTDQDDLVEEINDFFGIDIAFIEDLTTKHLRLEADVEFTVHKNGTANTALGLPTGSNTSNKAVSNIDGFFRIVEVGSSGNPTLRDRLEVLPVAPATGQSQHFRIVRPGVQRMHSTVMNEQVEYGLYYMDVELISEGSGDQWNLEEDQEFVVTGYSSDGYRLVPVDPNLTFSEEEDLDLILSRRILTVGSSDRPDLATQLSSQNIQVNYERSPLTASIQSFASSDLERVLNASILVRHLMPHFINFDVTYRGGSSADVVLQDINDHLDSLDPDDRVESSDIQDLILRRGADYVANPIELVAVAHDRERNITVDRSKDYVTKGRLATFLGDTINVTRETVAPL